MAAVLATEFPVVPIAVDLVIFKHEIRDLTIIEPGDRSATRGSGTQPDSAIEGTSGDEHTPPCGRFSQY